jgi:hypothetical protein
MIIHMKDSRQIRQIRDAVEKNGGWCEEVHEDPQSSDWLMKGMTPHVKPFMCRFSWAGQLKSVQLGLEKLSVGIGMSARELTNYWIMKVEDGI